MEKRKCIEFELRRDLVSGTKTAEEVLDEYYNMFMQDLKLKLNLDVSKLLQKTSKTLSSEQKATLLNMFQWPKNDVIKACIDADEELLLLGVECKEAMMENERIQTGDMLARYGKVIGLDLVSTFNNLFKEFQKEKSEQENLKFNKELIQLLEEHTNTAEEIITMFTERVFRKVSPSESKINDSVLRSVIQKCKGLCFFVSENERKELLNMNSWQNDDVVRRCIHEKADLLIFGLFIKHVEQVNQWIPPETFLAEIQRKLERNDLPNLFRLLKATEDEQQMQLTIFEEKRLKESKLLEDLKSKRKSAEYVLKQKLTNLTVKLGEDIDYANEPQFSNLMKLLRKLSKQFNNVQANVLFKQCKWDDEDVIRECIRVDNTLLIQGLWQKEIENMQAFTEPGNFILAVCKEVDRVDIYSLFKEEVKLIPFGDRFVNHIMDLSFGFLEKQLNLVPGKHVKTTTVDEATASDVSAKSDST